MVHLGESRSGWKCELTALLTYWHRVSCVIAVQIFWLNIPRNGEKPVPLSTSWLFCACLVIVIPNTWVSFFWLWDPHLLATLSESSPKDISLQCTSYLLWEKWAWFWWNWGSWTILRSSAWNFWGWSQGGLSFNKRMKAYRVDECMERWRMLLT